MKEPLTWNRILTAVLHMPGVKVDRTAFLRKALSDYCNDSKLDLLSNVRPYAIVPDKVIDRVAKTVINRHTALATTASTVAGLPGGLAMAATIPGDITQYYYHVVVLSQKLAYLYGFPDFCDEAGELNEMASDLLTIFMGSMMGVKVAEEGVSEIARGMAQQAVGRLPRVALTKTAVYPIAGKIAQVAGMKLTREGFAKGLGKLIPIAGGLFSGSLTLFTFTPGARRLQKRLKAQKIHFTDGDVKALEYDNIKASFQKAEHSQSHPEDRQRAMIQLMVNMANISGAVSEAKYDIIERQVAVSNLDADEKLEILGNIGTSEGQQTDFSYDVDYDLLASDSDVARDALKCMLKVVRADADAASSSELTMPERMYLTMTAKAVGLSKEDFDQMLNQSH